MASSYPVPATPEGVFTYGAPQLKFGPGAAAEIGYDLVQLGARRVLIVTDAGVAATGAPARIAEAMAAYGVTAEIFDRVHVEPTDTSLETAIGYAEDTGPWDAYVAVGGGSSIDTAKAVNLLTTNPGTLLDYVNVPVGAGRAPTEPLRPLVAVPTTTGTGSESTTICVLDVLAQHVKTGISHPRLRPTLAVVDPELTLTQPAGVTAAAGMDILCHALEAYTARPYAAYERKQAPERVPYCGANPIADMWAEQALGLLAGSFRRAVRRRRRPARPGADVDGGDLRGDGVRQRRGPHPPRQRLPHRRTGPGLPSPGVPPGRAARPARDGGRPYRPGGLPLHLRRRPGTPSAGGPAARPRRRRATAVDGSEVLPRVLIRLMRDIGLPDGCARVGYAVGDIPDLVEGSLMQQRLLATSPKPVTAEDLSGIFERSMRLW